MEFKIPQFIERKPKVVGPLTFHQFLYFGFVGVIGFILYFSAALHIFVIVTVFLFWVAAVLAFVKVGGKALPTVLMNFLNYSISSRMYLWRKKFMPPKIIKKMEKPEEKKEGGFTLKVAEKSQLNKLSTKVETQAR